MNLHTYVYFIRSFWKILSYTLKVVVKVRDMVMVRVRIKARFRAEIHDWNVYYRREHQSIGFHPQPGATHWDTRIIGTQQVTYGKPMASQFRLIS